MAEDGRSIVFRTDGYGPLVTDGADGLLYEMPVDSSFMSYAFSFPMTQADFDVLRSDPQRAALLYGALHHPFQLAATRLSDMQTAGLMQLVLHAPLDDVAAALNIRNRDSRNAIYHLAAMFSKLDPRFR